MNLKEFINSKAQYVIDVNKMALEQAYEHISARLLKEGFEKDNQAKIDKILKFEYENQEADFVLQFSVLFEKKKVSFSGHGLELARGYEDEKGILEYPEKVVKMIQEYVKQLAESKIIKKSAISNGFLSPNEKKAKITETVSNEPSQDKSLISRIR